MAAPVAFGVAELRPDPARPRGWTLLVDGVAQSYVDLAEPAHLEFAYVRRLAAVLRLAAPVSVPLRVLHLGGGGLTLPRLVSATRAGSFQKVVERDGELIALVTRLLPLAAPVEVVVGDARAELDHDEPHGYDVIVVDVFDGAWMPASVAGVGFAAAAARRLRPGGLLGMNLTDVPPLAYSRIQAATLRTAFGEVGLIAEPALLRGRRAGNVVLVAAHSPGDLPVRALAAAVARDPAPGRLLHGPELSSFAAGAKPRLDAPA
jgi:spermidine synthase